jgi:hypothetical protein
MGLDDGLAGMVGFSQPTSIDVAKRLAYWKKRKPNELLVLSAEQYLEAYKASGRQSDLNQAWDLLQAVSRKTY